MLHFKSLTNFQSCARAVVVPGLFLIFSLLFQDSLSAQEGGNFGIGFQAGDPTGLNLHFRGTKPMRLDILFAWDINSKDDRNFFFVNVHGLFFKPLSTSPKFNFYYGPGTYVGFRDYNRSDKDNDTVVGISGNFGINVEIDRFDIFLQLTPRLDLVPNTDFDIGGGIGARFFF